MALHKRLSQALLRVRSIPEDEHEHRAQNEDGGHHRCALPSWVPKPLQVVVWDVFKIGLEPIAWMGNYASNYLHALYP